MDHPCSSGGTGGDQGQTYMPNAKGAGLPAPNMDTTLLSGAHATLTALTRHVSGQVVLTTSIGRPVV